MKLLVTEDQQVRAVHVECT